MRGRWLDSIFTENEPVDRQVRVAGRLVLTIELDQTSERVTAASTRAEPY